MTETTKPRVPGVHQTIYQHVNIFFQRVRAVHNIRLVGMALVLICGGLVVIRYQQQLLTTMHHYRLLPQPERFTELYLNDHLTLPTVVSEDQVASASFTIHNREHRSESYPFVVRQQVNGYEELIGSGEARLSQDEQITIPFRFTLASPEAKTKIEIALLNTNQTVHFWVNKPY